MGKIVADSRVLVAISLSKMSSLYRGIDVNNITLKGIRCIAEGLARSAALLSLDLCIVFMESSVAGNNVGDEGAELLSQAICMSKKLETLVLSSKIVHPCR